MPLESPCIARSCGSGNVDCVGVSDPQFQRFLIGRCIYLRSFLGTISQGRLSSVIEQTLGPNFVLGLSLDHAGYSSAGLFLASLFFPPSSGVSVVPLFSATVRLAVQLLVSVFASAIALDCWFVSPVVGVLCHSSKAFIGSFDFRSRLFAIFTAASALPLDCEWYGDDMECLNSHVDEIVQIRHL